MNDANVTPEIAEIYAQYAEKLREAEEAERESRRLRADFYRACEAQTGLLLGQSHRYRSASYLVVGFELSEGHGRLKVVLKHSTWGTLTVAAENILDQKK